MKTMQPLPLFLVIPILLLNVGIARAELGDNNPTGVAGNFNGNVTTGCNYDPYTGNARRSITDIVVPGAVGAYPLAFTRIFNTRNFPSAGNPQGSVYSCFGGAGNWRHSYQWEVEPTFLTVAAGSCSNGAVAPTEYTVRYPDGDVVPFWPDGTPKNKGVGDRVVPMTASSGNYGTCSLIRQDGGRVDFSVLITRNCEPGIHYVDFNFSCTRITDPFGQQTTISGSPNGSALPSSIIIKEPAGRSLTVVWRDWQLLNGNTTYMVDRVEERATDNAPVVLRKVQYGYTSYGPYGIPSLTSVEYFNDPTLTASYTYQDSNSSTGGPPLISTCNDPMYSGPMGKIAYLFDTTNGRPHGFLLSENYWNGSGPPGPPVSTLSIPNGDVSKRKETRADGPSRTFTYADGLLVSWTDFRGNPFSQDHYATAPVGFVRHLTTLSGQTEFTRNEIGNVTDIKYPATSSDPPDGPAHVAFDYDPYRILRRTDERQNPTVYVRGDGAHHVTDISYPDGASEHFLFDNTASGYGQMLWHQRKNGKYEHIQYNTRGQLLYVWNPVASSNPAGSEPKTEYTYYPLGHAWQDRVQSIKDPRGYVTTYEYESNSSNNPNVPTIPRVGRGLVSKIINYDYSYRTFGYDQRGNKTWEENELRQRRTYIYDDYNRILSISTPLPNDGQAYTVYDYIPFNGVEAPSRYTTTSRNATFIQTPSGIVTKLRYDENGLPTETIYGFGAQDGTTATESYSYNYATHRLTITDASPSHNQTTIDYDTRGRRVTLTTPDIVDYNNVHAQYVTQWLYDPASNVSDVLLPDGTKIHREYDPMNRLWTNDLIKDHPDQPAEHRLTQYRYWPSGQIYQVEDPKHQITTFEYDERDLKSKMIYPNVEGGLNRILQGWIYDANGNMTQRPTIGGDLQWFTYDGRNRPRTMAWNTGIDWSSFGYDVVGRLTSALNPYSSVTRHYDEASGRMDWERQALTAGQNPAPITIRPVSVKSRKNHGSVGPFDIDLPLEGIAGSECRTGPEYTLVITFANPITVGGADVISGIGAVASVGAAGNVVTVNLKTVSDAQVITVRVFGLYDGVDAGEILIPMHVLVGNSIDHGVVNLDDKSLTSSRSGQQVDSNNFRSDLNADGSINSADLAIVEGAAATIAPVAVDAQDPTAVTVSYDYYDDGKVRNVFVEKANYDYDYFYDGRGRLKTIQEPSSGDSVGYEYDENSNVTSRTTRFSYGAVQTQLTFDHDELNRIKEEIVTVHSSGLVSHLHHGYDPNNRLTNTLHDETELLDAFHYSFTGELDVAQYGLQRVGTTNQFTNPDVATAYTYDNAGNRQTFNNVNYEVNGFNEYSQVGNDAVGNSAQHQIHYYQGTNYTYLADTALSKVEAQPLGTDVYELRYDAFGRTVRRTTNNVRSYYFYDRGNAILERDNAGELTASTLYGGEVDEVVWHDNNGGRQCLLQDRIGSTIALANAGGEVIERYSYNAFGTPTVMDPSGTPRPDNQSLFNNRFLFAGREWVSRFGFYENRARAYHPGLGRFMSEDPTGFAAGDTNLFRYCGNDPVNRRDPSGLGDRTSWRLGYTNEAINSSNAVGYPTGQGISTQGFWEDPSGFLTGTGGLGGKQGEVGGRPNGESAGQPGGSASIPSGYINIYWWLPGIPEVSVEVLGWYGTPFPIPSQSVLSLPITERGMSPYQRARSWLAIHHPEKRPGDYDPILMSPIPGGAAGMYDESTDKIYLDVGANNTTMQYIGTYSEELIHAQQPMWQTRFIGLFRGQEDPLGLHESVHNEAFAIQQEYLRDYAKHH